MTASNDLQVWKEAILIYFDNLYAAGKSISEMLTDTKAVVADTELGPMDYSIDSIMDEWKADRGIA